MYLPKKWPHTGILLVLVGLFILSGTSASHFLDDVFWKSSQFLSQSNGPGTVGKRALTEANHPNYPRQYHLWEPQEIRDKMLEWKAQYPDLIRVWTSQEKYGLPRSGNARDCTFDEGGAGCLHYAFSIQDFVAHPEDSPSSNRLPEVFWSGALHGNERVGPTAVMEAADLLLQAAACEAMPIKPNATSVDDSFKDVLDKANVCRNALRSKGMSDNHRQWLARLVATRRLVVVPTANALGYFRNQRTEESIDPNRDFPYDLNDPQVCMQTIAGRTVNEIFREHMFQLSLTFHGGTEVIGYEWGAPSYLHKWSPDDTAQAQIAHAYSLYAAGFANTVPYDVGTMNDKVYYVRGGMEDWAYAGSWDPKRVINCQPRTYNSYPKEKTTYNDSTLRVFNMLVETSNQKIPRQNTLGTSGSVLLRDTSGNGHVSRNIRLSLLSLDLVEPYVSIVGVNDLALSDDVVPLSEQSCKKLKKVMIPKNSGEVTVEWSVGGALSVDSTQLLFAKWSDIPDGTLDCVSQPSAEAIDKVFVHANPIGTTNGTGFFAPSGPQPHPSVSKTDIEPSLGPLFSATVDVSSMQPGDEIAVIASARADSSWSHQPPNVGPPMPPQAHIVNARTNPDWHHVSANKEITGRLDWFSVPVIIVVGNYADSIGSQAGHEISTLEVSNRFGFTTGGTKGGISPSKGKVNDSLSNKISWQQILAIGSALVIGVVLVLYARNRLHSSAGSKILSSYEEEGTSVSDEEMEGYAFEGDMEMKNYRDGTVNYRGGSSLGGTEGIMLDGHNFD